jgi:anti-sigma factor RsiW
LNLRNAFAPLIEEDSMHLEDGQLRAYLDDEVKADESAHLAQCAACQARLAEIEAHARFAGQRLAFIAAPEEKHIPAIRPALAHLQSRINKKETFMFSSIFSSKFRSVWIGLVVVVLLVGVFSFPSVRASAVQFLGIFRVQQVTVLPIDTSSLTNLTGNQALGQQLGQMVSSAVTVDKQPGNTQAAADAAQASSLAGFNVRLPATAPSQPQLVVQDGSAFHMVIDRARAQSFLNEAGLTNMVLPASVDGAKISVEIPSGITAAYGTCPTADTTRQLGSGSAGRRYPDCVMLFEIPSPTVNAPQGLDVASLVKLGLQATGMTPEQAAAYAASIDWTSTLVIPIPNNAATYQQVQVDGVTGTLIQRPADDAPQYVLVWVKDGVIYAISALGTDSTTAINMANAMH